MDSGTNHDGKETEECIKKSMEAKELKKLKECLEPLRENQIQIDSFTLFDMVNLFFLPNQIVKHVRVLTTIPYKDVRDSVLAKASSLGICPLNYELINLEHIAEVCRWMKTESGSKAVVEVQRIEKLKRRAAAKGRTLAEVSNMVGEKRKSVMVIGHDEESLSKTRPRKK